jgi:hypothetical protein
MLPFDRLVRDEAVELWLSFHVSRSEAFDVLNRTKCTKQVYAVHMLFSGEGRLNSCSP